MSDSRRQRPTMFQTETICSPSSDRASLSFPRAAGPLPGTCIGLCVEEQAVPGAQQEKAPKHTAQQWRHPRAGLGANTGPRAASWYEGPSHWPKCSKRPREKSLLCCGNYIKSRARRLPIPLAGTFDVLSAGLKAPVPQSPASPQALPAPSPAPPTPEASSLISSQ